VKESGHLWLLLAKSGQPIVLLVFLDFEEQDLLGYSGIHEIK
jgi:hypothetical protein